MPRLSQAREASDEFTEPDDSNQVQQGLHSDPDQTVSLRPAPYLLPPAPCCPHIMQARMQQELRRFHDLSRLADTR